MSSPPPKEKDPKIRYRFHETGTEVKPKKITFFLKHSGVLDMIFEFDPSEVIDLCHLRLHISDLIVKPKEIITGMMVGMVLFIAQSWINY